MWRMRKRQCNNICVQVLSCDLCNIVAHVGTSLAWLGSQCMLRGASFLLWALACAEPQSGRSGGSRGSPGGIHCDSLPASSPFSECNVFRVSLLSRRKVSMAMKTKEVKNKWRRYNKGSINMYSKLSKHLDQEQTCDIHVSHWLEVVLWAELNAIRILCGKLRHQPWMLCRGRAWFSFGFKWFPLWFSILMISFFFPFRFFVF